MANVIFTTNLKRHVDCPDSVVALVPFACLPGTTAGTFLLEDYEFTYVATATDLVHRAAPMTRGNECKLLAIGDVDYGDIPF